MTAQAQAEDRRAQIQAKLTRIGNLVANLAHPNVLSGMFIESGDHRQNNLEDEAHDLLRELLAELSRLSRVEQALRAIAEMKQCRNVPAGATRDLHVYACPHCTARAALSASPEAQTEESTNAG